MNRRYGKPHPDGGGMPDVPEMNWDERLKGVHPKHRDKDGKIRDWYPGKDHTPSADMKDFYRELEKKHSKQLKEGLVNEFVPKPGTHGRPLVQVPGGPGKFQDPLEWEQEQRLRELDRKMKEFEKRMLQMRLDMEKSMRAIQAREKYLLQQIEELDLRDAGEEPPPGNYWDGK